MDPNANLRRQEYILDIKLFPPVSGETRRDAYTEIRELRTALRAWLRSGGFEPDWAANPKAARHFGR